MKADYRVVCCIVAWLCCVAVHCRKDTSDWDDLDGNGIQDYGREYDGDDTLSILGKAIDLSNVLREGGGDDDDKDGKTKVCGDDCVNTGGTCTPTESDPAVEECTECPKDSKSDKTKIACIVEDERCDELHKKCRSTGGKCVPEPENIACRCPEGTTYDDANKNCEVEDKRCDQLFENNCRTTGGKCVSSPGKIECRCPAETTYDDTNKNCKVEEEKCSEKFPKCKITEGECLSSTDEIIRCKCPDGETIETDKSCTDDCGEDCTKTGGTCESMGATGVNLCSCPADTDLDKKKNMCIVQEKKCTEKFLICKTTGGECLPSTVGIKCKCPEGETIESDKSCSEDCGDDCTNTGGTCELIETTDVKQCSCPADTKLDKKKNTCIVQEEKCTEKFLICKTTGGECLSLTGGVKCKCPEGETIETDKSCSDECGDDCSNTGGTCEPIGSTDVKQCSCPTDTKLDKKKNTCIVNEKKCTDEFPNCKSTGGKCLSSPKGIKCSCPGGTTYGETDKNCIVDDAKCKAQYPDCESSGGRCLSTPEGIKCKCPEAMTVDATNSKCLDTCQSKCGLGKDETANAIVKCEKASDSITCLCVNPALKFDYNKKKCVDTCESRCGLAKDKLENDALKCNNDSDTVTCNCIKSEERFDYVKKQCIVCDCGEKSKDCKFEAGNKICTCEDKYADKQGKCSECDCGPNENGKCKFNGDKKVCSCKKGYEDKEGICEMTKCTKICGEGYEDKKIQCKPADDGEVECKCTEDKKGFDYANKQCKDCDCGTNYKECIFKDDKQKCICKDGYADKEGKCEACGCGTDSKGCVFIPTGKICVCKEKFADKKGVCVDCKCGGTVSKGCSFKGDEKTCKCVKNYAHVNETCKEDYCQIKCGCEEGGCEPDMVCEGNRFNKTETKCVCDDGKAFDSSLKKCRTPCEIKDGKSGCKNGAQCLGDGDKFCKCIEGTSGDVCDVVDACEEGGKYAKCVDDRGTCTFNEKSKSAECKCDKGKMLDQSKNYCVDKFCFEGNCKDNSTCEYDKEKHTGYCVCSEGKYYDYQENRCKSPDKCLLKKTACKENEVCFDGECKCAPPYEKDGEKCIRKFCKQTKCFSGAVCNEEKAACICEEGKIFTGYKCEEKKCIFDDKYEETCKCPRFTERKEGSKHCEPTSGEACDKNCGYGLCMNKKCKCFDGAEIVDEICVLKKSLCASQKLVKDSRSKCECDGNYKQAKDGQTCELITCEDEYAQKACATMGATCRMKWTSPPKFECECPEGYVMDNEKQICTDPCSLQKNIDVCLKDNKFCFNSISKSNLLTGDCRCPPPFSNANGCLELDKNVHLISGIPVAKKNYETKNGIDHILLNAHLTQSLTQTYTSAVFDYGYLYDYEVTEDTIISSVWVRFKNDASEQIQRVPFQAKQFAKVCEDCDANMYIWPPSLPLKEVLNKVVFTNLELCSPAVKDRLCGKEASCNKAGCSCPRGFRMLEYTARLTSDSRRIQRCEVTTKGDLDECKLGTHNCSENSECVKIPGDYICQCKPGYWKESNFNKDICYDLCAKKPCAKGKCTMQDDTFNCECEAGYGGSRCNTKDVNFASAKKSTVVVGAVLGTILIVGILAFLLYYRKIKKSSYSEDFMPAPSHAEMTERRPMRGVVNKSYE